MRRNVPNTRARRPRGSRTAPPESSCRRPLRRERRLLCRRSFPLRAEGAKALRVVLVAPEGPLRARVSDTVRLLGTGAAIWVKATDNLGRLPDSGYPARG